MRKAIIFPGIILALAGLNLLRVPVVYSAAPQIGGTSTVEQDREVQDRMQKAANKKRQEEIREDTQKLFQLATELKQAVDKSNENMLALDVIRKAEEVEKLAKRVKEKMREGSGKPLRTEPPPVALPRIPG